MSAITWVLESEAFPNGDVLHEAAVSHGDRIVAWDDVSWSTRAFPRFDGVVVFHGSLGNADRIQRELSWSPGAFCDTAKFACSTWYDSARKWLLQERYEILPACELVARADEIYARHGVDGRVFVRPDSPLKPFSGRIVTRERMSLAALDHGFYFDDENLSVVVAPVVSVSNERRFVVVNRTVVAGSGYRPDGRTATIAARHNDPAWGYAQDAAAELPAPSLVYVIDVCESVNGFRVVELNPFGGADLYACDAAPIVGAIHACY
ncbi:MAG: ATP-grasp domain-containing protein [Pirellulales bacterium]